MKKDFKISYSRGHGPGGQRKNKVETRVHIMHIPSGITEICQDTPSRARNEKIALDRMDKRLKRMDDDKKAKALNEARNKQLESKKPIRTYNFARNEVVDHRTGQRGNLKKVLNGSINLLR